MTIKEIRAFNAQRLGITERPQRAPLNAMDAKVTLKGGYSDRFAEVSWKDGKGKQHTKNIAHVCDGKTNAPRIVKHFAQQWVDA